ncbi:hypothetical protein HNY73_007375 [Argiope bruennichi]|uniref:PiggyBac transposable element-derived protein 4 C-terminal zinc-finger domain-containing protein n=1 Tax=Argiope bruennichi TaxID=94029 RepID=A0A8T0FDR5_ARGBR|nr:hypothetical protein HNY73_007375 [Argiope bruennichi]
MFKTCRKDDLRLIAKELGLNISDEMTVLELIDMIKKSDKFKTEPETVSKLENLIVEERKAENEKELAFEKLKLERTKIELEIARIRAEAKENNAESFEPNDSLNSLVKNSQVVLSWLSSPPRNWKPFVANRTSEILDLIPQNRWRYVPSKENPADIGSRDCINIANDNDDAVDDPDFFTPNGESNSEDEETQEDSIIQNENLDDREYIWSSNQQHKVTPSFDVKDAALINSYILYVDIHKMARNPHLDFRLRVARGLIGGFSSKKGKLSSNWVSTTKEIAIPKEIRTANVGAHMPEKGATYRRCKYCSTKLNQKRTKVLCTACDVPLCAAPCFASFHQNN